MDKAVYVVRVLADLCRRGENAYLFPGGIQYFVVTVWYRPHSLEEDGDPLKVLARTLGAEIDGTFDLLLPVSLFREVRDALHDRVIGWAYRIGNLELAVERKPSSAIRAEVRQATIFQP